MAAITRAQVAVIVHESLDSLAGDLTTSGDSTRTEGDYTYPLDEALRDCGYDAITEADSHGKIRAILRGTEFHILRRLYRKQASRAAQSQQGAGASGMHLAVNYESNIRSLRIHLAQARDEYASALEAIGLSLSADPESGGGAGQVVLVDDEDSLTQALVSDAVGLPWWSEGYHELDSV